MGYARRSRGDSRADGHFPSCTSQLAPAVHSESPMCTAGQEPPEGILVLSHEQAFGHFKKKKSKMNIFQLGDQGSVRASCPRGSQLRYRLPVIKALCYFPAVWKQKLPSIIAMRFHSRNDTFWRTQYSDFWQKPLLHDPHPSYTVNADGLKSSLRQPRVIRV